MVTPRGVVLALWVGLTGCQRQVETSLGAESLWVQHESTGVSARPAIQIETRTVPPTDRAVGVVVRSAVSFHDFGIVKRLTDWYDPNDSGELRALKTVALIPGLAGTPIIGSKSTSGYGMRVRFGQGPIAASIEGGLQGSAWSHLSQKVMPFDICIGGWGSTQLDLGKRFGLGLRATYDLPLVHSLLSKTNGIVGGSFVLTYVNKIGGSTKPKPAPPSVPSHVPGSDLEPGQQRIWPSNERDGSPRNAVRPGEPLH